jgi:chorismate mutase / prephenate dehydrogenase
MLNKLRDEIKSIDAQIASLVARRFELALEVGKEKEKTGQQVRDYSVEKAVLSRMNLLAEKHGIDSDILREMALTLIKGAVRLQVRNRGVAEIYADKTCCVVGGNGQMGSWLVKYATSLGYQTISLDQGDILDHRIVDADLVLLSAPLEIMDTVLQEILELRPRGVVLEIASLKSHLLDLVKKGIKDGIKIASIHPMFGPETDLLSGQNLVVCEAGCAEAEKVASDMFTGTAVNIVHIPIEKHDLYMTWVLNLPHLMNLIMGDLLFKSGVPHDMLSSLGGTTFNKQLSVTDEVMSENPDLYFHIQQINKHRDELRSAFIESLDNIHNSDKKDSFVSIMKNWETMSR